MVFNGPIKPGTLATIFRWGWNDTLFNEHPQSTHARNIHDARTLNDGTIVMVIHDGMYESFIIAEGRLGYVDKERLQIHK